VFYISSRGHSATGWLAKVLSSHPDIVCFHGTRSLPPYRSGINDIHPKDFIKGLVQMEDNTRGQKLFGACHGYNGNLSKQYTEDNGGVFMGILRDPIMRVNSIFSSYLPKKITHNILISQSGTPVYDLVNIHEKSINRKLEIIKNEVNISGTIDFLRTSGVTSFLRWAKMGHLIDKIKEIKKDINQRRIAKKENHIKEKINGISKDNFLEKISALPDDFIVEAIINTFVMSCIQTFKYDTEICLNCNDDQIINMEEMITSRDYFNNFIFKKLTGSSSENQFLDKVFAEQDHINLHSTANVKNPEIIFETWPKSLQNFFTAELNKCNAKIFYKKFGYPSI